MSGVLGVWVKTVENWYRKQAREQFGIADGKCASVSVVQHFGDGVVLNPHVHSIFCEGVWSCADGDGNPEFLQLNGPTDRDVQRIAMDVTHCVDNATPLVSRPSPPRPALAGTQRRRATRRGLRRQRRGPHRRRARASVVHQGSPPGPHRHWQARRPTAGSCGVPSFGLAFGSLPVSPLRSEAVGVARLREGPVVAVRIGPLARESLERLCRYILRPALCNARLERLPDGRILAKLKRRWSDGTWAKLFEPLDFLAKISALIPSPGRNLLRYHGQFAPQGRWRDKVVINATKRKKAACPDAPQQAQQRRMRWAELLKRSFLIDILECDKCGGRREVIAVIKDTNTVTKILDHVGITSAPQRFEPARAPPQQDWCEDSWD